MRMYKHLKFDSFQATVDSPSSLTSTGMTLPFFPLYRVVPHVICTLSLRWLVVEPKLLRPLLPNSELVGDEAAARPVSELVSDNARLVGLPKHEAADALTERRLCPGIKGERPRIDALRERIVVFVDGGLDAAGDTLLAGVFTGTCILAGLIVTSCMATGVGAARVAMGAIGALAKAIFVVEASQA